MMEVNDCHQLTIVSFCSHLILRSSIKEKSILDATHNPLDQKTWQDKRSKIRSDLTFPLTHTMPL
jgi:hypothetical protein